MKWQEVLPILVKHLDSCDVHALYVYTKIAEEEFSLLQLLWASLVQYRGSSRKSWKFFSLVSLKKAVC